MYNDDFEGGYSRERSGEEIYSKPVRAGKRTYFFDVKSTKGNNDFYLTITESKRKTEQDGRFTYDKHKIFLYKEDFEKFAEGLGDAVEYIKSRLGDNFNAEQTRPSAEQNENQSESDVF